MQEELMEKHVGIIVDSTKVSKQSADLVLLSKISKKYEIVALQKFHNFQQLNMMKMYDSQKKQNSNFCNLLSV
tara:strand:+ start:307 stop:525 length:219 start_codon:yes stop_codon:yes gene_type:complete